MGAFEFVIADMNQGILVAFFLEPGNSDSAIFLFAFDVIRGSTLVSLV